MKGKKTLVKAVSVLMILLIVFGAFAGCDAVGNGDIIENAAQLNSKDYTIVVSTGSSAASVLPKKFTNANFIYNSGSDSESYMMVNTGKADAFGYDKLTMEYAIATGGVKDAAILDEVFDTIDISVGVNRRCSAELLPGVNAFIKQIKEDGTLDDMKMRWVIKADETMPDIPEPESPDPDRIIKIGTAGLIAPMTYHGKNNELTGFEIELIKRYAHYANVNVQIEEMGFDSIIAGLQSERLDMAFSNLNVTDERREVIDFSDAYLYSEVVLLVQSDRVSDNGGINSVDDINGKNIGYLLGASYEPDLRKKFPDSKFDGFKNFSEVIQAIKAGRIDVYFADEPLAVSQLKETDGLKIIGDPVIDDIYAMIISQSRPELREEFNSALDKLKQNGTLDELKEKWINGDGDDYLKFDESIPTPKGSLNVGTVIDAMPFSYRSGDNMVGYDIELLYKICAELGYKPILTEYSFDALLAAVGTREDVVIGCITYTEERAETMLFTDSTYQGGPIAVIRSEEREDKDFFASIADSFDRTFIREDRWKLILNGLLVTIELSLLSILFGTLLGFVYSFPLRSKNKVVSGVAKTVSIIIDGLPLLVVLMVLYYVIFAKTTLSAIAIGVLGFTLDFANNVAGMLNTGIKAVDAGQIEAAESMGYSKLMVFRKITFPQAANQMFGQYSGAIISLIKGTSIIGYITVEDLTKAGDIIRSRTYEAFFPLIVTAIIYFIIARLFVFLLSRFGKKLDPKLRKRQIKGVITDDQH